MIKEFDFVLCKKSFENDGFKKDTYYKVILVIKKTEKTNGYWIALNEKVQYFFKDDTRNTQTFQTFEEFFCSLKELRLKKLKKLKI